MKTELIQQLIDLDDQMKEIKKKQESVKNIVKAEMLSTGQKSIAHNGRIIDLSESSRTTVKKKEDFVQLIMGKGLNTCVDMVIEPNLDRIKLAIQSGQISQAEFDSFVTETAVYTMKIK